MASLYLNDILYRNGLDPKRVKLIRHSLKHERCKKCFNSGFLEDYQRIQKENFFKGCDYMLSFISEPGTSAKFYGCFSVGNGVHVNEAIIPSGFPVPEMFSENNYFFDLKPAEQLSDLKDRLIIDWGKATVSWHQWASNDKVVLAIQSNPKYTFNGYENVILGYDELKEIIYDKILYENWHVALSSVYAIYLIVDSTSGKQYVGSAYGAGGLLERWRCYVETGHGGNEGIKEILFNNYSGKENFQFSILQILPKTITEDDVIRIENLYKIKLKSREFGMNKN